MNPKAQKPSSSPATWRCKLSTGDVSARRFLNDALQVLWPAFDRALGALLKVELRSEPQLLDTLENPGKP